MQNTQLISVRFASCLVAISLAVCPGCSCVELPEDQATPPRQSMPDEQPKSSDPKPTSTSPSKPTQPSSKPAAPTPSASAGGTSPGVSGADSKSSGKDRGSNDGTPSVESPSPGGGNGGVTSRSPGGGSGSKSPRPQYTAQQAVDAAKDSIAAAAEAFAADRPGDAFRDGLRAHDILSPHEDDPACRALLAQLEADLRRYAASANAQTTGPLLRSKTK